jgi:Flp pilus assembly protein TadG
MSRLVSFLRQQLHTVHPGTASIETALVFPVMMFMCIFIIQYGTLVYARQSSEEAARYGVRRGVVNVADPAGAAVAAADQYASSALPWGHETSVEAPGGVVGTVMRIRVTTVPPNILNPILGFFGGSTDFSVTAIAEGRMEGWAP